uniref:Retrovirus-related Pol polyprotein from transposon TNT 1-94-like beta-barrel domain-containing protein n=1 Tax=Solanum lycopersicum TaxID=4081 RepID=A0A3Q7HN41_SOLLC
MQDETNEASNASKYIYENQWDYSYQAADELPQASTGTNLQNTDNTLYVDSGASSHMTHKSSILTDLKHYSGLDKIMNGNRSKLDITHVGSISRSGKIFLLLYVDDITVTGSNPSHVSELEFAMKDLGNLHIFLGVEYVVELPDKSDMTFARAIATPLAQKHG